MDADTELRLVEEFGRSLSKPADDGPGETALQLMARYVVGLVGEVRDLRATVAAYRCSHADANCEGDVRPTPAGSLCGWHSAVRF